MNSAMERGRHYYATKRYDLAQQQFEEELANNPESGIANSYLALCLAHQDDFSRAKDACGRAIAFAPEDWFSYYASARVHRLDHKTKVAKKLILQALEIDPMNLSCLIMAGMLATDNKEWAEAGQWAEKAISVDPSDTEAQNIRALAYIHTGRLQEAEALLTDLLGLDASDAFTLANLGWVDLRKGQPEKALERFTAALAEDPEDPYARDGLMHALRSKYPLYGTVLRYMMWMSKFKTGEQLVITIMYSQIRKFLEQLARDYPALRPIINVLLWLWATFDYLCWTARPVTSLFLRFNKYGRRLLTQDEIDESTWVALALAGTGTFLFMHHFTGLMALKLAYIVCMTIVMPISDIYETPKGWKRQVIGGLTASTFLMGISGAWSFYQRPISGPAQQLFFGYLIGMMLIRLLSYLFNRKS